jgi:CheY-like chemotaxis protein
MAPHRPLRVIIVDDDRPTLDMFVSTLTAAGLEVWGTTRARRAVELAVEHIPDVIVVDLWMPEGGGRQLCRELAANPRTSIIPVVIVSADTNVLRDRLARRPRSR